MTISTYAQMQQYLISLLQGNISSTSGQNEELDSEQASPHGAFWKVLSYDAFVNGNVPNVTDPVTQQPMPIVVKGNPATSNFILALQGAAGTPFDPNSGAFGQMPADGPPYLTAEQIQPIADWISAGCPE